jgi:Secretion system C-terminal sorting domain
MKNLTLLFTTLFVFTLLMSGSILAQTANVERLPVMKDQSDKGPIGGDKKIFLKAENDTQIPRQVNFPYSSNAADILVNNNNGATGTSQFTQSEQDIIAYGNNVVIGYNDSGSFASGSHFTGWSYSSDGGATFTDGNFLPASSIGDAGDPALARDETTGRVYLSTLGFNGSQTIQIFRSDDDGHTWMAPTVGTPGATSQDKQWIAVDNFAGTGNGNVYLVVRDFGSGNGVRFYRSTDQGATFGPTSGLSLVSGNQGAFVAVGPDHSVYGFWYNGTTLQVRKSTDQGVSFGAAVTVVSGLTGGGNGDLGLTGIRNGTASASPFRSNSFPHAAVNPVSGDIYVTFNDNPAGTDKADVYMVMSNDGGASWGSRVTINDDGTTTDQWQPTIAVTPNGNTLGIFYYSRQDDPANNNLFAFYGILGNISGSTVTFGPSFAISDVTSLPEFGRDNVVNSVYMSDYTHASATNSDFHVIWSDNRDDLSGGAPRKDPNVYYEKIPIGPPCPVGVASNPNPATGTTDVTVNLASISWTNGASTNTNETYFGTNPASLPLVQSGTLATSWNITGGPLAYSTTYYWRIIEVGDTCSQTGPLWSFTTESDPNIVDTTFYCDDFEAGAGGWTITNDGGTCVWDISTLARPYTMPPTASGNVFAADEDLCGSGTTLLSTATLNTSFDFTDPAPGISYVMVWVEFDNDWRFLQASDEAHVQASSDGGTTWTGVWDQVGVDARNSHEIVDLSAYIGQSNVMLRMKSIQPGWDWWWAVDNFCIHGEYVTPVELTSFAANVNEGNVNLNWSTATETNNQGFDIERKTATSEYQKIGYVAGFGTTTETHSYSFNDDNVTAGSYSYRLKQVDFDGTFEYSNEVNVDVTAPLEFALDQNYPNPFNPSTTIKYSTAQDGLVKLAVYNLLGEEVTTLVNTTQKAGRYEVNFNASQLASGVYIYRIETPNFTSAKKLMLMK